MRIIALDKEFPTSWAIIIVVVILSFEVAVY